MSDLPNSAPEGYEVEKHWTFKIVVVLYGFSVPFLILTSIYMLFVSKHAGYYLRFFENTPAFTGDSLIGWVLSVAYIALLGAFLISLIFGILYPAIVFDHRALAKRPKLLVDLYVILLSPFVDLLISSAFGRFNIEYLDRASTMLLGCGSVAMIFGVASGARIFPKAVQNWLVAICSLVILLIFYAGLWASGAMGNPFNIFVWHALFFLVAVSSYRRTRDVFPGRPQNSPG